MTIGGRKRKPVAKLWPLAAATLVTPLILGGCSVDSPADVAIPAFAPQALPGSGTAIAIDGTPVQCSLGSRYMTYDQLPQNGGKVFDIDDPDSGKATITQYASEAQKEANKEEADYTAFYNNDELFPTPYSVVKGDGNPLVDSKDDIVDQATRAALETIYHNARQACDAKFDWVGYNLPASATVTFGKMRLLLG